MPFAISLKHPTLPLSLIKFLQQIDVPSSSYELFSAYPWNLHFTTIPVFASNLGLGSIMRLENSITGCLAMVNSMMKLSELSLQEKWRFISLYTSKPASVGNQSDTAQQGVLYSMNRS